MLTGFQLSGIVLISASAFPRQSLDADTLAFLTCSCVADTSIVTLNTYCLALCNCSPQLISTSAFQRQSLDTDTPALHLRRRRFNCDFEGLDVPENTIPWHILFRHRVVRQGQYLQPRYPPQLLVLATSLLCG